MFEISAALAILAFVMLCVLLQYLFAQEPWDDRKTDMLMFLSFVVGGVLGAAALAGLFGFESMGLEQ
ncbi:MAG: hypothetical protein L0Y57_12750 [Beijerinckiaceae bacterium]|nr:hypothetical protein [Beijerinckiaceae bacterium]